jgi:hypothetical protein
MRGDEKNMTRTRTFAQWMELAERHQGYVESLEDGYIGRNEIAVSGMSVEEAIGVERRNVLFCLACGVPAGGAR